ncbi:MAG TPA: putative lipoprotein [Myxococcota bacterium]|nr:putative lipoprotein [Myxococcota bacterium]
MPSRQLAPIVAVLVIGLFACSFSDSSESISKSLSSPFKSSSDSSGDSHLAYQADVRDYTAAYIRSGGDYDTFERKIGSVAAKHGITDWELDTGSYVAIGQGLRKGGLKPIELAAWKSNLARDDLSRADLIQKGYDGNQ